ncbi:tRNA-splicing ligase RtcB [Catenulispora sp. GP43]|uniref:RtcB family protein n=1 Tax=Catenulispora sp. GP43 TaxID=3156263 RepID=UPI003518F30D
MYTTIPGSTEQSSPIRMWADPESVEPQALEQLRNVAALPWTRGVAVMPDVHPGIGATVGSVIAMEGAVSPAAVGVDIGCGMSAVKTTLTVDQLPDDLGKLRSRIEQAIPVGRGLHHKELRLEAVQEPGAKKPLRGWHEFWQGFDDLERTVTRGKLGKIHQQLGTLGGGNHYIELTFDKPGSVWLMLHSGSRGIGNQLAAHHIEVARTLPQNQDLPDPDLAVFLADTPQMAAYRRDLFWAQEYARRNRAVMLWLFSEVMRKEFPKIGFDKAISCHHNYVAEETYDGVDVLVTRKGAIRAGGGDLGIIPGSMGTGSYIVRGLGNDAAFNSASHGAGRRMSRTQARKQFTVEDLKVQTKGVECRKDPGVVDEIPGAYKDIRSVMAQQTDLVEIVAELKQVVCVKG